MVIQQLGEGIKSLISINFYIAKLYFQFLFFFLAH